MKLTIFFLLTDNRNGTVIGLATDKDQAIDMARAFANEHDFCLGSAADDSSLWNLMRDTFRRTGGHGGHMDMTFLPLFDEQEAEGYKKFAVKIETIIPDVINPNAYGKPFLRA